MQLRFRGADSRKLFGPSVVSYGRDLPPVYAVVPMYARFSAGFRFRAEELVITITYERVARPRQRT